MQPRLGRTDWDPEDPGDMLERPILEVMEGQDLSIGD